MASDVQTVNTETLINEFFDGWCRRHNIVASVEAGLEFREAKFAWRRAKEDHRSMRGMMNAAMEVSGRERESAKFFKAKADQWLTAYQDSRIKSHRDFARYFIRRPRLRRIVLFLMRFG